MVLFGNEFDADERAEVGGVLRGGEGVIGYVALDYAFNVHGVPENLLIQQIELGVETDGGQFVFIHQKLREFTVRRPIMAIG